MQFDLQIATDIGAKAHQVNAAIALLDGGATVPFIARYRKEATQGLDDTQLRQLEERLTYLRTMESRRETILSKIAEMDKLTPELEKKIQSALSKTELEDLYLPYKSSRRTRADQARDAGLQTLADQLLAQNAEDFPQLAASFLNSEAGYDTQEKVLEGAADILMQHFSEQAELVGTLRELLWQRGHIQSRLKKGKEQAGRKFSDYFDYNEAIKKIPSHRTLALFRARGEAIIDLKLLIPEAAEGIEHPALRKICHYFRLDTQNNALSAWLQEVASKAWQKKISPHLTLDLFGRIRETAEDEAIRVFRGNIKDILLAAPAGPRATLGLDPGLRTGVKVAVVDAQGSVLKTETIYPHVPQKQWDESLASLHQICVQHRVELVSIGNGTGSRETEALVSELNKKHPELKLTSVTVSEAGASVYSASVVAAREFPDMDVSLRGAVSIARRLQDPMAELVKIDPRSIGVGQYQHDVNQQKLADALDACVEDCVNAVGVDLNLASEHLLARVAGLGPAIAEQIVLFREKNGPFARRNDLHDVPRLGPKTYEQCAGFLRIRNGREPLDASGVHPESYPLVARILKQIDQSLERVLGKGSLPKPVDTNLLVDEHFGEPTIKDVISELEKPGRDPRAGFKSARFQEGVDSIADLKPNLILEGVVTNVTNFGAFIDIGVHQDGLVHISSMSDKFIDDPRKVVKTGDIVKVRVTEIDVQRKRIGLSMRLEEQAERQSAPPAKKARPKAQKRTQTKSPAKKPASKTAFKPTGAMADAFAKARRK